MLRRLKLLFCGGSPYAATQLGKQAAEGAEAGSAAAASSEAAATTAGAECSPQQELYQTANKLLAAHLDGLMAGDQAGLQAEFNSLQDADYHGASDVAEQRMNAPKNRYVNVLPFDFNRVKISGDDYINASLLQCGPDETPSWAYVAAQGPLASTTTDFWKMVLENKIPVIVMLTRVVENNHIKCADYFPHGLGETSTYGVYRVSTLELKQVNSDVTLRVLQVKNHKTQEAIKVTHLHYHLWPDHGVPEGLDSILAMSKLLQSNVQQHTATHSPVSVVHCSAGIGRTGVFVAIDIILRRLSALAQEQQPVPEARIRQALDVAAVVQELRRQRRGMVQTLEQYQFIYRVLLKQLDTLS